MLKHPGAPGIRHIEKFTANNTQYNKQKSPRCAEGQNIKTHIRNQEINHHRKHYDNFRYHQPQQCHPFFAYMCPPYTENRITNQKRKSKTDNSILYYIENARLNSQNMKFSRHLPRYIFEWCSAGKGHSKFHFLYIGILKNHIFVLVIPEYKNFNGLQNTPDPERPVRVAQSEIINQKQNKKGIKNRVSQILNFKSHHARIGAVHL